MEMKNWFKKSVNIISISILIMGAVMTFYGTYVMKKDSRQMANMSYQLSKKDAQLDNLNIKVDIIQDSNKKLQEQLQASQNTNKILQKEVKDESTKLKETNKQLVSAKKKSSSVTSRDLQNTYETINVVATAYTANCSEGCSGRTRTGINVNNTTHINDKRIVAVDTNLIPLHSVLKITTSKGDTFYAQAEDTGGAIVGHKIDVLMSSQQEAINFGVQGAKIEVLRKGA